MIYVEEERSSLNSVPSRHGDLCITWRDAFFPSPEGRGSKVRDLTQRGVRMSRSAPPIIRLARLGRGRAEGAGEGGFWRAIQDSFSRSKPHLNYNRAAFYLLIQRAENVGRNLFRHLRKTVILKGRRPVESRVFFLA
jgi:hypothetical protein